MLSGLRRVVGASCALVLVAGLAVGLAGCKKKKMMDPVMMALMTPGVRTVVIPKQRSDLRVVVPPCSAAAVSQGSTKVPPGSNEIVVPTGTLTQMVAVQPCPPPGMAMMGGMMMMPPPSSTILLTPGGTSAPQQGGMMMMTMQNQLVLPANSSITTVIVSPCQTSMGGGMMMSMGGDQGLALPSAGKGVKTVTAPPCTAPPAMGG